MADPDVVVALREAASALEIPHRTGITHSKDSFFGETEKERMPMSVEVAAPLASWPSRMPTVVVPRAIRLSAAPLVSQRYHPSRPDCYSRSVSL